MSRPELISQFGSLPRDPDRDAVLVDIRRSERTRDEIVLSAELDRKLTRIESEYRAREMLARQGLAVRSRLLLVGPPGCGKTLCAEVLAADLGLTLLYARFDGIVSSYLGETASNLRRLFNYARQHQAVLFFDEFDVLGKRRDDPQDVGELKRVVSSFLQLLDTYPRDQIVVAATRRSGDDSTKSCSSIDLLRPNSSSCSRSDCGACAGGASISRRSPVGCSSSHSPMRNGFASKP
jgi:SpoVK/Ycf46/Vps4 family AAA+-type ATPase